MPDGAGKTEALQGLPAAAPAPPQVVRARLSAGRGHWGAGRGPRVPRPGYPQHDGVRRVATGRQHRLQGAQELLHRVVLSLG